MKNYLITFATYFLGSLIFIHLLVFIMLFGMWELDRFHELYESDGFWSMIRILFIISLIVPIFSKFKIIKL